MKKILLVEDDEDSYDMLVRSLQRENYDPIGAHDGPDAIEKVEKESPDLILMDIRLPEFDGLEATRRIRSKGSNVPIIALTAYAMENDQEKAQEAGCDDYHVKPVAFPQLQRQIDALLE